MNEAAARQVRRDIRRAMGPRALDTIDAQADAIGGLRSQVLVLAEVAQAAADRFNQAEQRLDRLEAQTLPVGMVARLRWLVGR